MKRFTSLFLLVIMVVSTLFFQSCGNTEIPDDCTSLDLSSFTEDYKSNSLRLEEKYVDEWCKIVCTINAIESDKHFTMLNSQDRVYIDCRVKDKELKDVLLELNKGDKVKVYGVVTKITPSASSFWDVTIHINVYKIEIL